MNSKTIPERIWEIKRNHLGEMNMSFSKMDLIFFQLKTAHTYCLTVSECGSTGSSSDHGGTTVLSRLQSRGQRGCPCQAQAVAGSFHCRVQVYVSWDPLCPWTQTPPSLSYGPPSSKPIIAEPPHLRSFSHLESLPRKHYWTLSQNV